MEKVSVNIIKSGEKGVAMSIWIQQKENRQYFYPTLHYLNKFNTKVKSTSKVSNEFCGIPKISNYGTDI